MEKIKNKKMGINKLIIIGPIGNKQCYLNIGREAAVKKYCESENYFKESLEIEEIEFDTEFNVYDIWN